MRVLSAFLVLRAAQLRPRWFETRELTFFEVKRAIAPNFRSGSVRTAFYNAKFSCGLQPPIAIVNRLRVTSWPRESDSAARCRRYCQDVCRRPRPQGGVVRPAGG